MLSRARTLPRRIFENALAAIAITLAGAFGAHVMDGSPSPPGADASVAPTPTSVAVPSAAGVLGDPAAELDTVVAFLFDNRERFRSARDACDMAFECSVIDATAPQTGAVARAADVPQCIAQRLPICETAARRIEQSQPPAVIRDDWGGVLDMHVHHMRENARVLADMIAEGRRLRVPKQRSRPCVLDELPDGDKFERRSMQASFAGSQGVARWDSLDEALKKHGACAGAQLPGACGLATFLGDDPRKVGARYAGLYR
ncbi:MAG: hypothetical protein JWN04_5090 [Myxococcaceae bacterium]|nr:hypothetical protein [Myxococcaceae bacterium]